jgi:hypothetical protein
MLGRRSFLISCGSLVAGLAPAKSGGARTSPIVSPPPQLETNETPAVVLRIAGWDTPLDSAQSASSGVWISINGSWRTAWR